jgi:hypothetical protein
MDGLSIVVEGRADAELLRKVLAADELRDVRFFAAGGRISLSTIGRNILVHEGAPVLVVMDADTLNPDVARHIPAEVFSFVPEIEVVFFEAPGALAMALGRQPEKAEILQGVTSPKQTLGSLLKQAGIDPAMEALLAHVDERGVEALRRGKQMSSLIELLQHLVETSPGLVGKSS